MLDMGKAHDAMALAASKDDQVFGVLLGLIAGLTYAGYSWAAKQHIDAGANSKSAMA